MQSGSSQVAVASGFGIEESKQRAELAAISVAAAAKAQIEAHFIMALKKPRNEELARARMKDRCKDRSFADAAIYSKPVGGQSIEGLSIRFAEDLLALWGNIKVKQTIIFEDDVRRVINVNVIDLETNTSYESDLTIEKTVERKAAGPEREKISERLNTRGERVFILKATEDEVNIKTASAVSKAIRNNGLRCVPGHIKEEAFSLMNEVLAGKVKENPEAERRKLVDAFNDLSIKPDRLEEYLGHDLAITSPAELVSLRKIYNAIKSGETNWSEVVASKSEAPAKKQEAAKGSFEAGDQKTHQGHDDVSAMRKGLLSDAEAWQKKLTTEVFKTMLKKLGFESAAQLNDNQLADFLVLCEETFKASK